MQNQKQKDDKKVKPVDDSTKYPAGELIIYFGSQTGTAESFARILMKEGKSKGFNAKILDLEEFSPEVLAKTKLAVFLMATYGEGEPTDNAINFNKWLKNEENETESTFLSSVQYSVFGLGNRQYEHFNAMGKFTDQSLGKFNAQRVYDYGEGDDDGTLEEDYDNWKSSLWLTLLKKFHPDNQNEEDSNDNKQFDYQKVELSYTLELLDKRHSARLEQNPFNAEALSLKANASTRFYFNSVKSKIQCNRELRGNAGASIKINGNGSTNSGKDIGSTRHIELDLSEHNLKYNTADNLACIPQNDLSTVNKLADCLNYDVAQWVHIVPVGEPSDIEKFKFPFPTPCTIQEILSSYVDIHGVPKHATLGYLVPYVTDSSEKAWLLDVLSKENRKAFIDTVEGGGKSLYELFTNELSSCKLPLADFLHIVPPMQPRYYTISSSSSVYPSSVHITVSVTSTPLKSGKLIAGLCSTHLSKLSTFNSTCRIFIRPSTFRLPSSVTTPIVMIGPGTGIAPMRALIQEREYQYNQLNEQEKIQMSNVLYFGCKNRSEDYIYSDELEKYEKSGILTKLHLAFSRECSEKVYVQHLLKKTENAKELMSDLEGGGYVYVCGATAMGEDVHRTIVEIVQAEKGVSREEAEKYVKHLQTSGRYIQELWTA